MLATYQRTGNVGYHVNCRYRRNGLCKLTGIVTYAKRVGNNARKIHYYEKITAPLHLSIDVKNVQKKIKNVKKRKKRNKNKKLLKTLDKKRLSPIHNA